MFDRFQNSRNALGLIFMLPAALLLLLFLFTHFHGPNPPLAASGGDGVELNYGLDEAGSGDIQSMAPANNSLNREDSRLPKASPDPQPRPVATATPAPTPPPEPPEACVSRPVAAASARPASGDAPASVGPLSEITTLAQL